MPVFNYKFNSNRTLQVDAKKGSVHTWFTIRPAPGEDWVQRSATIPPSDAIQLAVDLLTELAPEKLAVPPRIPLGELPHGTFLRAAKGHRHVAGVVKIVPDEPEPGTSAAPEEYRVVMDSDGRKFTVYNTASRTYWEPVKVEVRHYEEWVVIDD